MQDACNGQVEDLTNCGTPERYTTLTMLHQRFSTVMRFCVSVPVLSLAMMVALPRFSMMSVRLISTCLSRRRSAVRDSREVTVAGKPCTQQQAAQM